MGEFGHLSVKIITNNPLVKERLANLLEVDYRELSYPDLLKSIRDDVHSGTILLTHPLSGSVKPGETPYKSVMVDTGGQGSTDFDSVSLIESAIAVTEKLMKHPLRRPEQLSERVHKDFQLVDLTLIQSALPSAGYTQI